MKHQMLCRASHVGFAGLLIAVLVTAASGQAAAQDKGIPGILEALARLEEKLDASHPGSFGNVRFTPEAPVANAAGNLVICGMVNITVAELPHPPSRIDGEP